MKNNISEFFRRGLIACGMGPVILAIVYMMLQRFELVDTLTVNEVCIGIFSLSALSFIAGGMNIIYQIERIPLMLAIFIHGGVLYISYLATYLLNNWLVWGVTPILIFSGIFVFGYFVIWAVIFCITRKNTKKLNDILKQKHNILKGN
ncbi:MAG: DUF3021 domain-containing protein [Oscillospiraceae bacterium]|nr:DUF3021 domain-containing protein [Oscillospiraceae bacterium]